MITVKLYGLLRIDFGIRECRISARNIDDILQHLTALGIPKDRLRGSLILVNGKPAGRRCSLQDGDEVQLMPPVAGG